MIGNIKFLLVLIGCTLSAQVVVSVRKKPGINSLFEPSRFCPGFTSDSGHPPFRYHNATRRCYMVGDKGPCPDLMEFAMLDEDYGECDCDQKRRCGRPLMYWPGTKRCYFVNDQGPCQPGKWLVFGFNLQPICKLNRCRKEQSEEPSNERKFWFTFQGQCYRTQTRGFCREGEILFNNWTEYRPTCNKIGACPEAPRIHTMGCQPGSKLDYEGRCKRTFAYKY
ncbi:unnamed protein product [Allacma fusca]|uniref:DUF4789 domain-containing protein n=1 Tax=Allacma fusca TaxID=39272 RepID=A0A8J2JM25_9HEXA|nr:unnamed protein product [Allacma fusca]